MTDNFYSASAKGYDELYGEEQNKKLELITEILRKKKINIGGKVQKIIDVGCGSGISTKYFDCAAGIDPCKELLEIAGKKFQEITFLEASAENIPFEDNEFDYSVSLTAAQNFSDMKRAVEEMNRVSKKGILVTILKNSGKREGLKKNLEKIRHVSLIEEECDKDCIFVLVKTL